jgi:uncharacterized cupredoxin-like copper-binding protein
MLTNPSQVIVLLALFKSKKEIFMPKLNLFVVAALAIAASLPITQPAAADSVVSVKLTDKGGTMDMSKSMGMGMGMHGNMTMAVMGISINPKSVLHGKVKFNVTNTSRTLVHEMLVAPIADENVVLSFKAAENRVDEEAAKDLGEVSELDPGKSGSLIVDMKPGKYILYCNIPGHFMAGMWTVLEVR